MKGNLLLAGACLAVIAGSTFLWVREVRSWQAPEPEHGPMRIGDFVIEQATVPVAEIFPGGPKRDGIPSIDAPEFVPAERARDLPADDPVLSFTHHGQTRAFPLRILERHEIVNDRLGDLAFVVTYCPLCGTAMVFDRTVDGRTLTFGVSGLLYRSALLMYDRQTDSLWSQIAMQAVTGLMASRRLRWLEAEQMTWAAWKAAHPRGQVLAPPRSSTRDYKERPYARYEQSPRPAFPVAYTRRELPQKARVLGIVVRGRPKAYPLKSLASASPLVDRVSDEALEIRYDPEADGPQVRRALSGRPVPAVVVYWFAWQAFHPDTDLWRAPSGVARAE